MEAEQSAAERGCDADTDGTGIGVCGDWELRK